MHDFLKQIIFVYRKGRKSPTTIFVWYVDMYYEILHVIM